MDTGPQHSLQVFVQKARNLFWATDPSPVFRLIPNEIKQSTKREKLEKNTYPVSNS